MGLLDRLFRQAEPPDPPTDKQLAFAKRKSIHVPDNATKSDLINLIAQWKRANPEEVAKGQQITSKIVDRKLGKEGAEVRAYWEKLEHEQAAVVAVYERGKKTVVDVLAVGEVEVIETKKTAKVKVWFEAPKFMRDRYIGEHILWGETNPFGLETTKILWHQIFARNFSGIREGLKIQEYRKAVEKGMKVAEKLIR